jgi:hypothetical protein
MLRPKSRKDRLHFVLKILLGYIFIFKSGNMVNMNMRDYPTLHLDTNPSKGTACSKTGHGCK